MTATGLGESLVFDDDIDVTAGFPFGDACSLPVDCGALRRSRTLSRPCSGVDLLAGTLVVARKYGDGDEVRIGVRRGAVTGTLVARMPADTTLAEHRAAVTEGLVELRAVRAAPKLVCVVEGTDVARDGADLVVSADGNRLHIDAHVHVHDVAFVGRMLGHLANVLDQLADRPDTPLREVSMLTDAELAELHAFNATRTPYPRNASIPALFAAQVAARPDQVAVCDQDGSLTYRELDQRSGRLAGMLHRHGVGRHSRVAFLLEKNCGLMVAVLAVLRLGGAYVPIDKAWPANRRDFLLADSGVALLLADEDVRVDVPVLDPTRPHDTDPPPEVEIGPLDAAYVMYTSGTTGLPKGVLVNHRAVVRLVRGNGYVDFSPTTRMLQTGAIAFDATTFEFWGALLNGGTLVMVPGAAVLNAGDLGAAIAAHRANTMFLTSTLFNQLVEQDPTIFAGCQVVVGGEAVSGRHVAMAAAVCPDAVFVNGYGPTENTTFSVTHRIESRYASRVPIGRPIANATAWVLDHDGNPQPLGVPGELYVGGDGLGDGYLGRPELTAAAFVDRRGERLYRTGDRALWTGHGLLDCLGRTDHQVKIRGFRVELAEVESHLAALPDVREVAVVLVWRAEGVFVLRACYTADTAVEAVDLRAALAAELPDYMVPTSWLRLDAIPLNHNGKVDRAALERLDEPAVPVTGRAPSTPLESTVADIFAEVLKVPRVGADGDFFALGGTSLTVMRLWNRIRSALGVEVELRQLLDAPTPAGVVSIVERGDAAPTALRPRLVRRR
ncbi:non-ribosomal peptide synthetase [Actinocrispum wychmicini]|uniref:Amino acid adenylation domain-containing protein n=1 Tax=Actinocrispum wychmicini TaxID=1213861 RepID=A0A4R2JBK6_9PSEU|nr:non-ribosomal peptide synthetase [Actinocrispum wychmicini]TCO55757.1 amino acid adenylation domain-containing protein [Actinocrispum wychmicini]